MISTNLSLNHLNPRLVRSLCPQSETPESSEESPVEVDPFWYELATKDKNNLDVFVLSNITKDSSVIPTFTYGQSKLNGEKVLDRAINFIRLPVLPIEGNADASTERQNLLPTKIGRFRLKRSESLGDTSTIEVWREVAGHEIPRPPEGWDDLGAGGAFVQGRWAWGKERKSIVEGTVAQRTPFRDSEQDSRPAHLMLKVAVLLACSWVAITVTVGGIVSAPLAVGRSFYYLFRIPQKYVHDPLAFCIGACVFFPMLSLVVGAFNDVVGDATMRDRLRQWFHRFHLPPRQKLVVFVESLFMWFFAAPLALGVSYEVVAVNTVNWFAGEKDIVDLKMLALGWLVGAVILNSWAFLTYFRVFTKDFWANIGNGILEPPLDDNGEPVRNDRNVGNMPARNGEHQQQAIEEPHRAWQGKDGRVSQFFNVWRSVLFDWEWESVDRTVLLDEFAFPILKQIVIALLGSFSSFLISLYAAGAILKVEETGIVGTHYKYNFAFLVC
jgi:E3 ubiquitin-protein ligase MARCH6